MYDEMVKKLGIDGGIALNLVVDDSILVQRITGRRMCKECGEIYNIYSDTMKPKKENVCDKCGGSLYQRDDDNEAALKTRVETYYKVTAPVVDYYKEKGILYEVNSEEADKTLEEVETILKDLGE
jgi:adenylate kinase